MSETENEEEHYSSQPRHGQYRRQQSTQSRGSLFSDESDDDDNEIHNESTHHSQRSSSTQSSQQSRSDGRRSRLQEDLVVPTLNRERSNNQSRGPALFTLETDDPDITPSSFECNGGVIMSLSASTARGNGQFLDGINNIVNLVQRIAGVKAVIAMKSHIAINPKFAYLWTGDPDFQTHYKLNICELGINAAFFVVFIGNVDLIKKALLETIHNHLDSQTTTTKTLSTLTTQNYQKLVELLYFSIPRRKERPVQGVYAVSANAPKTKYVNTMMNSCLHEFQMEFEADDLSHLTQAFFARLQNKVTSVMMAASEHDYFGIPKPEIQAVTPYHPALIAYYVTTSGVLFSASNCMRIGEFSKFFHLAPAAEDKFADLIGQLLMESNHKFNSTIGLRPQIRSSLSFNSQSWSLADEDVSADFTPTDAAYEKFKDVSPCIITDINNAISAIICQLGTLSIYHPCGNPSLIAAEVGTSNDLSNVKPETRVFASSATQTLMVDNINPSVLTRVRGILSSISTSSEENPIIEDRLLYDAIKLAAIDNTMDNQAVTHLMILLSALMYTVSTKRKFTIFGILEGESGTYKTTLITLLKTFACVDDVYINAGQLCLTLDSPSSTDLKMLASMAGVIWIPMRDECGPFVAHLMFPSSSHGVSIRGNVLSLLSNPNCASRTAGLTNVARCVYSSTGAMTLTPGVRPVVKSAELVGRTYTIESKNFGRVPISFNKDGLLANHTAIGIVIKFLHFHLHASIPSFCLLSRLTQSTNVDQSSVEYTDSYLRFASSILSSFVVSRRLLQMIEMIWDFFHIYGLALLAIVSMETQLTTNQGELSHALIYYPLEQSSVLYLTMTRLYLATVHPLSYLVNILFAIAPVLRISQSLPFRHHWLSFFEWLSQENRNSTSPGSLLKQITRDSDITFKNQATRHEYTFTISPQLANEFTTFMRVLTQYMTERSVSIFYEQQKNQFSAKSETTTFKVTYDTRVAGTADCLPLTTKTAIPLFTVGMTECKHDDIQPIFTNAALPPLRLILCRDVLIPVAHHYLRDSACLTHPIAQIYPSYLSVLTSPIAPPLVASHSTFEKVDSVIRANQLTHHILPFSAIFFQYHHDKKTPPDISEDDLRILQDSNYMNFTEESRWSDYVDAEFYQVVIGAMKTAQQSARVCADQYRERYLPMSQTPANQISLVNSTKTTLPNANLYSSLIRVTNHINQQARVEDSPQSNPQPSNSQRRLSSSSSSSRRDRPRPAQPQGRAQQNSRPSFPPDLQLSKRARQGSSRSRIFPVSASALESDEDDNS